MAGMRPGSIARAFGGGIDRRLALVSLLLAAIAGAAIAAPLLGHGSPLDQDLFALNQPPGPAHWLGTDNLGRDVYTRLLYGTRASLVIGVAGAAVAFLVGAGLGILAQIAGRIPEMIVFGAIDLIRALPGTLLALLLLVALGSGPAPLTAALGLSFAPLVAYVARAAYRREIARDYVRAAASFGGGRLHVVKRHVLPNLAGTLVTQAVIILPRCIVTESVLSFLGIGSQPDAPTLGRMIADASRFIERAPHAIVAPMAALVVLTLCLSVLGDLIRQRVDPVRNAMRDAPEDSEEPAPAAMAAPEASS